MGLTLYSDGVCCCEVSRIYSYMWNWDLVLKLEIPRYWTLSYSQDSPAVSETDLRTAFSSEDVHNLCPLLFAPATDLASKLKPQLIT